VSLRGANYRILYFFHGTAAAAVSHGIVKERILPPQEIGRAIQRKRLFESNPAGHQLREGAK
jgi:hypothetical protein